MRFDPTRLRALVRSIFQSAGCEAAEAECVAENLVDANLVGHDSHGVLRVARYVRFLQEGMVLANRKISVVFENDVLAVVDGHFGLGQSVGAQALELGLRKSERHGVAVVALRHAGHLGRIGHWAETAVRAGRFSLHFVNALGPGRLVAPFGGIGRRLSASPLAAGIPVAGGAPIVYDVSTSALAEGKIAVALNKGVPVTEGCIVDARGRPTTDAKAFYEEPHGAILPFGGHKGYGLALVTEILSGVLTGGGCSDPALTRLEQGMLTILLDPVRFQPGEWLGAETRRFVDFVRASEPAAPGGRVLMPGDLERETRAERLAKGIELDAATWDQLAAVARASGVAAELVDAAVE
jgi:uncharacterized oxidoreductase